MHKHSAGGAVKPAKKFTLSFKHKLMLSIMLSIFVVFGVGGVAANLLIHGRLIEQARHQMELTSQGIHATVRGLVNSSIKNYLKGISETNLSYVQRTYQRLLAGEITEEQAKAETANALLQQKVGDSGYLVALNCSDPDHPTVAVHPNPALIGNGVDKFPFMRHECYLKNGYFEFSVKLPNSEKRLKSMWVTWFEPWKWTLGATPFKDEYAKLVDLSGIEDELSKVKMQARGYAFIMDMNGLLLSHPQWKGRNMINSVDAKTGEPFVRNTLNKIRRAVAEGDPEGETGVLQYQIKDPVGKRVYHRMLNYRYVHGVDWVVGVVSDLDDLNEPLTVVRNTQMAVIATSIILALFFIGWIVRPMTRSITELADAVEKFDGGHIDTPFSSQSNDEIGQLAHSFQAMAERLSNYTEDLEHQVAERTQNLEKANNAKTRFLAAASHDLRQPLHAIKMFVTSLENSLHTHGDEAQARNLDSLEKIRTSVDALGELLNSLLHISKLDAGGVKVQTKVFPVQGLLDTSYKTFESRAVEKGLAFRIAPCSLMVESDPVLLKCIIDNLISNAVRYTESGGILIGCRRSGENVRIEIWDTGIGIPEDKFSDVLGEFYQLNNSARQREKGFGLGLSIVNRSAELLGHQLEIRSSQKKGSVFSITVPQGTNPNAKVIANYEQEQHKLLVSKKPVLVVDDDDLVLYATVSLLQAWGYNVTGVSSSEEALDLVSSGGISPALVIVDYQLPGEMNGLDVHRAIGSICGRYVPGIVISGATSPSDLNAFSKSGLQHMTKPMNPKEARHIIDNLLSDTRQHYA